jgi:hypothetical protein
LIINIGSEEKIGRFGSVAWRAPFGRQPLQLNRTAERKAESAADQAPSERTLTFVGEMFCKFDSHDHGYQMVNLNSFIWRLFLPNFFLFIDNQTKLNKIVSKKVHQTS